jgi:hypothetical protein
MSAIGWPLVGLGFVLVGALALAAYGLRYRKRFPALRDFAVFRPLSDEVGRAAEKGAIIHLALGSGGLTGMQAMTSVAALEALTALGDLFAGYDTPPIITTGDPTLYLLAGDWMRRAYARLGNAPRYRPALVQFVAPTPTTYAAWASSYLFSSGLSSNIMMGAFDQEVSLIADVALRRGIYSVGGAASPRALGALYPVLPAEQLAVGEELFAGGARVTERSAYHASLLAQDALRWLIIVAIILSVILSILGIEVG